MGPEKQNLLEYLRRRHISLTAECGGHGICGKCRVLFPAEAAPPPSTKDREVFDKEQLAQGWRLACGHRLSGEVTIFLPSMDGEEEAEMIKTSAFLEENSEGRFPVPETE